MKRESTHWYSVFLHGLLIVFAALALLLAAENRRLKAAPAAGQGPELLATGTALPAVSVNELDGSQSELRFDGQRETVAMLFTTTCGVCEDNLSNWLDLYERLGADLDFVAIGLDDPPAVRDYADRKSLPFRVVTPENKLDFVKRFKARGVPLTILADAAGRVKKIQIGRVLDW